MTTFIGMVIVIIIAGFILGLVLLGIGMALAAVVALILGVVTMLANLLK